MDGRKHPPPQYWREAATLIVTGHTAPTSSSTHNLGQGAFDYQTLLLQRSPAARFMPGRHVFPGGAVDQEDFADEWGELYQRVTGQSMTGKRVREWAGEGGSVCVCPKVKGSFSASSE